MRFIWNTMENQQVKSKVATYLLVSEGREAPSNPID